MLCIRHVRWNNSSALLNLLLKNRYSRRSDKSTSTQKVIKTNDDAFDDVDGTVLGINSNWELLTPNGFRFYLPGCVGPGWSDASTTIQGNTSLTDVATRNTFAYSKKEQAQRKGSTKRCKVQLPSLKCVAQECPLLLRKNIEELFPGCREFDCSQITIVTISQTTNFRLMKWNKEVETEKLAKKFILMASDICMKLKMIGYWADFINPFSGKPHLGPQRQKALYTTDERFRCLGFKIDHKNNCKIISCDGSLKNFIGNLYTTAPMSTEFFKEIVDNCVLVNADEG